MKALAAFVAVLLLAGCSATSSAQERPLLVAAASDLQPAFEELGRTYTQQTGRPVTFTFGSSGQLAQQIVNGAPFELFASASVRYVDDVVKAGAGRAGTQADYAVGRLAVWTRGGQVTLQQLTSPRFRRIAIAHPDHAPYGLAAEQALKSSGIYSAVRSRLVYGENVSDTLRLAASGNADVALVAVSVATAARDGRFTVVPAAAHAPLRQVLVVTADDGRTGPASTFADLVRSPRGRQVLARYGFSEPSGG